MSAPAAVRREALWRRSRRGAILYTCSWAAPERAPPPVARLIMLCGYNSNVMAQHDWLASWLTSHGVETHSLDNHSFGRSSAEHAHNVAPVSFLDAVQRVFARVFLGFGLRAYVPSFPALVDDASWFLETLDEERGRLPTFLYGESMGAALALSTARALEARGGVPLEGLILSAPMCSIGSAALPHPALIFVGSLLARVIPTVPAPFLADLTDKIFRHEARRKEALQNPYRHHGPPRIGTAFSLKHAAEAAARDAGALRLPLLLLHGSADAVCPPAASHAVFTSSPSRDKTLVECTGAWHALWAEPVDTRRRLLADVLGWVAARAPTLPPRGICPDGVSEGPCAHLSPAAAAAAVERGEHGTRHARPFGTGPWRDESAWTTARDAHAREDANKEG